MFDGQFLDGGLLCRESFRKVTSFRPEIMTGSFRLLMSSELRMALNTFLSIIRSKHYFLHIQSRLAATISTYWTQPNVHLKKAKRLRNLHACLPFLIFFLFPNHSWSSGVVNSLYLMFRLDNNLISVFQELDKFNFLLTTKSDNSFLEGR